MPENQGNSPASPDLEKFWLEALPSLEGKRVKVTVKQPNEPEPGSTTHPGYTTVDYFGIVLKPAIQMFVDEPTQQQIGNCLYLRTLDQLKQVLAIRLSQIIEVDDEYQIPEPKEIANSSLAIPDK